MNSPGSAVVNTIKSGGNKFKMLNNLTYQQESFVGDNNERRAQQARLHRPAEHQVLGRPHRHRRPDQDRQGLVLRRLQPLQDRQADLGRAAQHRHRPRRLRQLHDEGNLEGVAEGHRRRLLPVGPEAEAEPRAVGDRVAGGGAAAGQRLVGLQGRALSACGAIACSPTSRSTCSATTSRSASRPTTRRSRRRLDTGTNFTSGAAWDAFDLARQKPAVTAQSTYYVPAAMGSHDLKVGFEYLLDIAKYAIDGRSGPIRYRDLNGNDQRDPVRRRRRQRDPRLDAGEGRTIATSATPATRRTAGTRTAG